MAFGLLTGSIGGMFSVFWQFLTLAGGLFSMGGDFITGQLTFGIVLLVLLVFVPLTVLVSLFVSSAVLHLFLLILKGADHGFEATFRVASYSQSAQLMGLIPFIGGWISSIWQIVLQVIGLKEMHETSYYKVILAFVIPLSIILMTAVIILVWFISFIGSTPLGRIWS